MSQMWKDRLVSWAVWLACAAPLLWFVVQGFTGDLGANPIQYVLRQPCNGSSRTSARISSGVRWR